MKKIYLLAIVLFASTFAFSQIAATTSDGRRILIYPNGSWRYMDSTTNSTSYQSGSINSLYSEAYDYAYEIMFANEFFPNERKGKARNWALQNMTTYISIPIGTKSLEQWFDDLYGFAYATLYKNEFFSSERSQKSIEWATQVLNTKSYFEDFRGSYFSKLRISYNFAYTRVYKNEFFTEDRRRKALNWASDFVKKVG